jgi:hypothetical protein
MRTNRRAIACEIGCLDAGDGPECTNPNRTAGPAGCGSVALLPRAGGCLNPVGAYSTDTPYIPAAFPWGVAMFRRSFVMNPRPVQAPRAYRALGAPGGSARLIACALAGALAFAGLSEVAVGQDAAKDAGKAEPNLEGAWSGGGKVTFAMTGSSESARCRAHYRRRTKDTYSVQATCATASGKAAQTATVHKIGEGRYRGNFHNAEYDISGTMFVVVNGNSQSVRLTSSSGSASLKLSR